MRFDRERLIFKALCALDEIVDDCHAGPVKPTFAMQFALAYLYAMSNGDRAFYDEFWRETRDPKTNSYSDHDRRYLRSTHARTALTGIARSVGIEMTVQVMHALSDARKSRNAEPN